ncbi:MAG: Kelch repeat-containing protein [Patescibacteria group bacterium]
MKTYCVLCFVCAALLVAACGSVNAEDHDLPGQGGQSGSAGSAGNPAGSGGSEQDSGTDVQQDTNPPSSHWESMGGYAPEARDLHSAIWTGSQMVIWGGRIWSDAQPHYVYPATGGLYDPATDSWTMVSATHALQGRIGHTAIWTGSQMVIWGGANKDGMTLTGGVYDLATDSWTVISTANAPVPRYLHVSVWTGSKVIVTGGLVESTYATKTGGIYDLATDTWSKMADMPEECEEQAAVWTGSQMLVFGGFNNVPGAYCGNYAYDPTTDTWTELHPANAPTKRLYPTAVWTGNKMIGWGGYLRTDPLEPQNTGGIYDPTDSWQSLSMKDVPKARLSYTAVWTGKAMIVWGGFDSKCLDTGAEYDLATDTWTAMPTIAPIARTFHSAIWTGKAMIVWGGFDGTQNLADGGIYYPAN